MSLPLGSWIAAILVLGLRVARRYPKTTAIVLVTWIVVANIIMAVQPPKNAATVISGPTPDPVTHLCPNKMWAPDGIHCQVLYETLTP